MNSQSTAREDGETRGESLSDFGFAVFNSLAESTAVLDQHGVIIAVNDAWREFAGENGISEVTAACEGVDYLAVCRQSFMREGSDVSGALAGIQSVLSGGKNDFQMEYPCHSPNRMRWFRMRVRRLGGGRPGVIVSHTEITDRVNAELVARDEEAHLYAILDASPIPMRVNRADHCIAFVNGAFVRAFGYTLQDIPTLQAWWDTAYPDAVYREGVKSAFLADVEQLKGTGGTPVVPGELTLRCADGTTRDALVIATRLSNDRGHITAFYDITEKKRMQARIQQSEEMHRNLLVNIQVGVVIQARAGEIILANPKALELLGLTRDQILGKTSMDPDWNVIHEDGSPFPGDTHPVSQVIKTLKPVFNVVMGVHRPVNADRVWLQVNATPEFDGNGTVRQVICSFADITEQRRSRQALQSKQAALEEVLNTIESRRDAVVQSIATNVDKLIMPRLEALRLSASGVQKQVLAHIESELREIASPFAEEVRRQGKSLTTVEVRICQSIKKGLSVKEIASLEGSSTATISTHRKNIRRKLGLAHRKTNLTSYLQALESPAPIVSH